LLADERRGSECLSYRPPARAQTSVGGSSGGDRNSAISHGRRQACPRCHWAHSGPRPMRLARKGSGSRPGRYGAPRSQAARDSHPALSLPCGRWARPARTAQSAPWSSPGKALARSRELPHRHRAREAPRAHSRGTREPRWLCHSQRAGSGRKAPPRGPASERARPTRKHRLRSPQRAGGP